MDRVGDRMVPLPEHAVLIIGERGDQVLLRVADERSVLDHGRADRAALQEQEMYAGFPGGHVELLRRVDDHAGLGHRLAFDGQLAGIDIERPHGARVGHRKGERRAGLELGMPDRDVAVGSGRPGRGRWGRRRTPGELAGDHLHPSHPARGVGLLDDRGLLGPQDREVGVGSLVLRREVEPDLEQVQGIGLVVVDEREHLTVGDAAAGGQPLGVAAAITGLRALRVGVIDQALLDHGHGLEPTMRMRREAGDGRAVIHIPAVLAGEVLADIATLEARPGSHVRVTGGIAVEVMRSEQERVGTGPRPGQREGLQDCGHRIPISADSG